MGDKKDSFAYYTMVFVGILLLVLVLVFFFYVIFNCNRFRCGPTKRNNCGNKRRTWRACDGDSNMSNNSNNNSNAVVTQEFSYAPYTRLNRAQTRVVTDARNSDQMSNSENTTNAESTNWCGYVAATSLTNPLTNSVGGGVGSFVVPTLNSNVTARNNNVSIWTGEDGAFNSDPTVQQCGIDLAFTNGRTVAYAWVEFYPLGPIQIVGFPINAGDTITPSVQWVSGTTYQVILTNNTRGVRAVR